MYNILRGHIKKISFKLDKKSQQKVSEELLNEWLKPLRLIDLIEYNGTEYNRSETSRREQNRPEPNRTESNRIEPKNRIESSNRI